MAERRHMLLFEQVRKSRHKGAFLVLRKWSVCSSIQRISSLSRCRRCWAKLTWVWITRAIHSRKRILEVRSATSPSYIASRWAAWLPLTKRRLVREPQLGNTGTLRMAARRAEGVFLRIETPITRLIALTDSDCFPAMCPLKEWRPSLNDQHLFHTPISSHRLSLSIADRWAALCAPWFLWAASLCLQR